MKKIIIAVSLLSILSTTVFAQDKVEFSKASSITGGVFIVGGLITIGAVKFDIAENIEGIIINASEAATIAVVGMAIVGAGVIVLAVEASDYFTEKSKLSKKEQALLEREFNHYSKLINFHDKYENVLPMDRKYSAIASTLDCDNCSDSQKSHLFADIFNKAASVANTYRNVEIKDISMKEVKQKLGFESEINSLIALSYLNSALIINSL